MMEKIWIVSLDKKGEIVATEHHLKGTKTYQRYRSSFFDENIRDVIINFKDHSSQIVTYERD